MCGFAGLIDIKRSHTEEALKRAVDRMAEKYGIAA